MAAAGPWVTRSQSFEFIHTSGQQHPVSAASPAWQKVTDPPASTRMFEALHEGVKPDISRDHVLMNAAASVPDADVPSISGKAAMWDQLSSDIPDMTPEMVILADLIGKSDSYLSRQLSNGLAARGAQRCRHLSDAFARMGSNFISQAERTAIEAAINELLAEYGLPACPAPELMQQWDTAMQWWEQRTRFAHPLGGRGTISAAKLAQLSSAIDDNTEFADVRRAGHLLMAAVQRMVAERCLVEVE